MRYQMSQFAGARVAWTAVLALLATAASAAPAKPTYVLRSARSPGAIDRVTLEIEVGGDAKEIVEGKVKTRPMTIQGRSEYHEKTVAATKRPAASRMDDASPPFTSWRGMRHYSKAVADFVLGDERHKWVLRPDRHLISVAVDASKLTIFSPAGTLTRDELELIDVAGNTILLDALLPSRPVAVGDSWKHPLEIMAALLGFDAVNRAEVQSTLIGATESSARIEMTGRVEGVYKGGSTEIEVKAKYRFNFKTERIDWIGLLAKDQRSIGHIYGLDVVARLLITIQPEADCPELNDAAVKNLSQEPREELLQLTYRGPQDAWEFTYGRAWFIAGEDREGAVFKMLDRGELVAHCEVSSLPKATDANQTSLAEFQEGVKAALGNAFRRFAEADQFKNSAGCRVYRVVVEGQTAKMPVQWSYCLVSDEHGHRVTFRFTSDPKHPGQADQQMVQSFRFAK